MDCQSSHVGCPGGSMHVIIVDTICTMSVCMPMSEHVLCALTPSSGPCESWAVWALSCPTQSREYSGGAART